jgi:hypothetical protein
MKVKITIDIENSAFAGLPGLEVGRILRELATRVEAAASYPDEWEAPRLRDINGNAVGEVLIDDE